LDGLDDYAIRSDDDEAFDITNAFTVQAWVNYNTVGGEQQLITKRVGSSGWSVNNLAAGPANVIEVNAVPNAIGAGAPGGSARSGDAVTDGVWTHVVFRLDGNTPAVFVNNEDNTDSNPCPGDVPCGGWTFSAAHNTTQPLLLGGARGSRPLPTNRTL